MILFSLWLLNSQCICRKSLWKLVLNASRSCGKYGLIVSLPHTLELKETQIIDATIYCCSSRRCFQCTNIYYLFVGIPWRLMAYELCVAHVASSQQLFALLFAPYVTPTASHVSRFQSGWLSFVDLTKTSHQLVRDKRVRFQLRGHSCAFVEYRNRIRWLFIYSFGLRATRIHRISQIIPHVEGAGWSRKWLRKTPKQNHLRRVTIFPQR